MTAAEVHHAIIASFIARGHPPRITDEAIHELADEHGVVLHPGTTEVWIAHPFATAPTGVWVDRGDRGWWAPCVWCAMGIVALAAPDATIHARYGGEAEAVRIEVSGGIVRSDGCVHFPIPARDAWNNVAYWCATVQPFRRADDVPAWCTRHALPHGAVVPIAQVAKLGRAWYGRHAARDWRKWTVAEARAIFDGVGLVGPHWELPASDTRF